MCLLAYIQIHSCKLGLFQWPYKIIICAPITPFHGSLAQLNTAVPTKLPVMSIKTEKYIYGVILVLFYF